MIPGDGDPARELRRLLAEGRYQEVLERQAGLGPSADAGMALAVATAATRLGRLTEGQALAGSSLSAFRARADDDGRLRCLNLLGAIAFERGELADAAVQWTQALELARTARDAQMGARTSNNLASVMHLQGRVPEARSLYREALLSYQRLADRRGVAETCHNLALTYRQEADFPSAEEAGTEAVRHAELVGDPLLLALLLAGRAETRVGLGDFVLALSDLDRAAGLARLANDPLGQAEVDRVRALRWLELREPERALAVVEPARAEAARLGSALLQGECAAVAFRALAGLGRNPEARARHQEAEALFRSLGALSQLSQLGPAI